MRLLRYRSAKHVEDFRLEVFRCYHGTALGLAGQWRSYCYVWLWRLCK